MFLGLISCQWQMTGGRPHTSCEHQQGFDGCGKMPMMMLLPCENCTLVLDKSPAVPCLRHDPASCILGMGVAACIGVQMLSPDRRADPQAAAEASKPILGQLKLVEQRTADISMDHQYLFLKP